MTRPTIGLVAPLAPQIGGVAQVAEWLLAHAPEIGCTYAPFDLRRPLDKGAGGRLADATVFSQLRLLVRFVRWLPRSPRVVHICVSCTPTGLPRDALYVLLLAAARRRTIAHVHGSDLELAVRARGRGIALRTIGRRAAAVVAVSPRPAAELDAAGVEATYVFNPIGIEVGASAPERRERPDAPLQLLFVGAYGRRKGVYELLDALVHLRRQGDDVRARIVGPPEHPEEAELLAAGVRERGLADVVAVIGPVQPDEVARELLGADVFCLPSHREGLPMAILEAMAFGLPVVATAVGGIPDVVRDNESGLLVAPSDVAGLTAALAALAREPELRRRLGENGRSLVEELAGASVVAARWRELYASVLSCAADQ